MSGRLIAIDAFLERHVDVDLLGITGGRGRYPGTSKGPFFRFTPLADHRRLESFCRESFLSPMVTLGPPLLQCSLDRLVSIETGLGQLDGRRSPTTLFLVFM